MPFAWRQKFDYDGYIATDHTKAKLIDSYEAIERKEENQKGDKKDKKGKAPDKLVKKKLSFIRTKVLRVTTIVNIMERTHPMILPTVIP